MKFDDAFEIVMASARPLGSERVSIKDNGALNRILAEDVFTDTDIPAFNKSAKDGFACRRANLANELTIIETIPAGTLPKKTIGQNQCAKISTGAVVPEGADCVIMLEHTQILPDNRIRFTADSTDDNIRPKGQDAKKADVVLRKGCKIGAAHIAVLASSGCVNPLVALQPKVGVIATGSELVEPGRKALPYQIRSSNAFQLTAQAANAGAVPKNYGIVADTEQAITDTLKKAIAENDVVISSGGVSVGDYDLVRKALEKNNIKVLFERISVNPGRPIVFGVSDEVFCFGLPGNPVSAFIMFELLVKTFLFEMMGHDFKPTVARMELEKTITRKNSERDSWLPVVSTRNGKITGFEYHGSAHINALPEADGLLCIPAGIAEITKGSIVEVRLI